MKTCLALIAVAIAAAPAWAQHEHSPYAGHQDREIKALPEAEMAGLLAGEGLGFALAAELNGYPGPKHALELAVDLDLSAEQEQRTRQIFDRMRREAESLGELLVDAERRLDRAFAARTIDPEALAELVREAAELRGAIRLAHLNAHLALAGVLDQHQIQRYNELRGYVERHGG